MGILTRSKHIKITRSTIDWYLSKGYHAELQKEIDVKLEDILPNSSISIELQCDYCQKYFSRSLSNHSSRKSKNDLISCKSCSWRKRKMANNLESTYKGGSKTDQTEESLREAWGKVGLEIVGDVSNYKNLTTQLETICTFHAEAGTFKTCLTSVRNSKYCCRIGTSESRTLSRRKDPELARKTFLDYNLIPCFENEDYVNSKTPLPFICPNHKNQGIQFRTEWNVKNSKYKCLHCRDLGKRKFPEMNTSISTPFKLYLRSCTYIWRNRIQKECGYKCALSGSGSYDVHHLISFESILQSCMDELEIKKDTLIDDSLLKRLSQLLKDKHENIGGVCLKKEIHNLFHHIYGKTDNTPDQYYEFKAKYEEGGFNGRLSS